MQGTDLPEGYRPIIGIPIPVQQGSQGPLLVADAVGAWAVERMSGRVLLIPLWPFPTHKHRYQSLWPLLQVVDGLLLPAGPSEIDWYTVWMEQATSSAPLAWALSWEIAFAQLATWMRMPILAIAEGAEKWNVALGGHWQSRSFVSETPQEAWTQQTIRVRTNSAIGVWIQQVLAAQHTKNGAAKPWSLPLCQQRIVAHLGMGLRSCA
ncbi:MAG: gamma-glutamyl-gamma-aminobutyrate hydrolase family protein, partial [Ktedonobacteraceae bacterium]|nr:gamma-glutamyl-gamma-aminobutyrate hydrolase family protein [Ktedonobacteraceae bacterium]